MNLAMMRRKNTAEVLKAASVVLLLFLLRGPPRGPLGLGSRSIATLL